MDANGPSEFPAIDEAAKAATLLSKLGESRQITIPKTEVRAVATASGLNPRHELNGLLDVLKKKRLIDDSADEVTVLGITTRGSLQHASDLFHDAEPSAYEKASIDLGEIASRAPVRRAKVAEELGDLHSLPNMQVYDLLDRAEEVGFVDKEGGDDDRLLFNGNLFRPESMAKTEKVLSALNEKEQRLVVEVNILLKTVGCLSIKAIESILSPPLLEKLLAAGVYDLNKVTNDRGSHVFVTAPSAFHKFVDPMVDDCFDMAKPLVAALTYGVTARSTGMGRINMLPAPLGKVDQRL